MEAERLLDRIGADAEDGPEDVLLEERGLERERAERGSDRGLVTLDEPLERASSADLHEILPRSRSNRCTTPKRRLGKPASVR